MHLPCGPGNRETLKGFSYAEPDSLDPGQCRVSVKRVRVNEFQWVLPVKPSTETGMTDPVTEKETRILTKQTDWRTQRHRQLVTCTYTGDDVEGDHCGGQDRHGQGSRDYGRRSGRNARGSAGSGVTTTEKAGRPWGPTRSMGCPAVSAKDDYSQDDHRRDDGGPSQRPKCNLQPQSTPRKGNSSPASSLSGRAAGLWRGKACWLAVGKQGQEQPQEEGEKGQHQLDERELEWQPRDTPRPAVKTLRNGNGQGHEVCHFRPGPQPHLPEVRPDARRREREKSPENEIRCPTSQPPEPGQLLKVMAAPASEEGVWVKRRANASAWPQSSNAEQQSAKSDGGGAPARLLQEGPTWNNQSQADGVSVQRWRLQHGPRGGGNTDGGRSLRGNMAERNQTPEKPEDPASALGACCSPQPVLSPTPSPPWNTPEQNQSPFRKDKIKLTISWGQAGGGGPQRIVRTTGRNQQTGYCHGRFQNVLIFHRSNGPKKLKTKWLKSMINAHKQNIMPNY